MANANALESSRWLGLNAVKGLNVMVTAMNRASKNETREMVDNPKGKGQISQETTKFRDDMKIGNEKIDAAIKARSESFVLLAEAGAHAVLFYATHGRTELMNRLFTGLLKSKSRIDAENFRQSYLARLVDEFGVGGEKELGEDGQPTGKWKTRNTLFVKFDTKPEDSHSYFVPANYKKGAEADPVRQGHVTQAKANMREAGLEGLMAIDWIRPEAIVRPDVELDGDKFRGELTRLLAKYVKAGAIPISQINDIVRVAGVTGDNRAKLNKTIQETTARMTAETETPESPKPEGEQQQVAA